MSYLTRRFDQPSYGSQKNYTARTQVIISFKVKRPEFRGDYENTGIVWLLLGLLIHAGNPAIWLHLYVFVNSRDVTYSAELAIDRVSSASS